MPLSSKRELLRSVRAATLASAADWVRAACAIKGISLDEPAAGEEWSTGPYSLITATSALEKTLTLLTAGRSPISQVTVGRAPGKRSTLEVFPYVTKDAVLRDIDARVWLRPGVTLEEARAGIARELRRPDAPPRVTLVLGAGNITAIPALDVLSALFHENSAAIVKLNPLTDGMLPSIEAAFAPLIELGVVAVTRGDSELGQRLIDDDRIDRVHLTGSKQSHDAIVWGEGEEADRRREAGEPRVTKPVTSELGGVGPAIIVPNERWSDENVDAVARNVATQRLHNSGFNCVATQIVILPEAWAKADAFVDRLRHHLAAAPARPAYYPGASRRQLAVITEHPDANVLGGDPNVPRTVVDHLDPEKADEHLFTQEAFGPVLGVVRLAGTREPAPFLDSAIAFANDRLAGSLSASIHIHPSTLEELDTRFDESIANLRYGTIGVNAWGGTVFGMPGGTWGAFPGQTLADVGSGIGIVHNALLLDPAHVERTVAHGPWHAQPTPLWYVGNRTAHVTARRLTRFAGIDSWAIAAPIGAAALDSYRRG
ncbi:MAG: aldehyde dehydrogenase family protein [Microcella sp.]|uniref:aldehyde dehydrogenase family protein n=1 Tax=Microcella sp. TaxID=1913979 RepID=UPI003314AE72